MKTIGEKIKELRRSKGLSQKDLADQLGITSQAVSKWETGTSLPEMTMLPDIAAIFGIQIDDLFEYSTEKHYESIEKKIEYGKSLSNIEFANEEEFLLNEIEKDPENYRAISLIGDLYRYQATRLNRKSVHYAKQALAIRPNQKGDINNINNASNGKLFDWDVANHNELISFWQDTLRKEPENTSVFFYLLDNLIDDGRLREAAEVLGESKIKNPDKLNQYYEILIKEKKNGFASVKEEYEALLNQNKDDWRLLFAIANSFCYNEYYEEAIGVWQKCFDVMPKPRYTDPFMAMAQCEIRMGNPKKAIPYYEKLLELLRDEWDIKYGDEVDQLNEKIRKLSE